MVDTDPQTTTPAAAAGEDAPMQQPASAATAENEKKDDTQTSSEPIPSSSSPDKPTSSSTATDPTSSSQLPESASQPTGESSDKGKAKESASAASVPENPTMTTTTTSTTTATTTTSTPAAATAAPDVPTKEDSDSLSIEPSGSAGAALTNPDNSPVCNITLLLPTGARHPYRLDERYLAKRSVDVPDSTEAGKKDPFSISVYTLKELILREWREEWNDKPASPSSIRLIHFGKLLDDKEQLKKYQFSRETPNVVHMSVRPAEMMEEDEAAKGKSGRGEGRTREGSGNCCVIL